MGWKRGGLPSLLALFGFPRLAMLFETRAFTRLVKASVNGEERVVLLPNLLGLPELESADGTQTECTRRTEKERLTYHASHLLIVIDGWYVQDSDLNRGP